jgi:hypothetical protein
VKLICVPVCPSDEEAECLRSGFYFNVKILRSRLCYGESFLEDAGEDTRALAIALVMGDGEFDVRSYADSYFDYALFRISAKS